MNAQQRVYLKYLNLSNNKINDANAILLFKGLKHIGHVLRELNLSKNIISDKCWDKMQSYIEIADGLIVLNLRWNNIGAKGAMKIFKAIDLGSKLCNLDLGYNKIGNSDIFDLDDMNIENLKHLDLSYNRLSKKVWEKFAEYIHDNHTLYGLHMQGNECYVDNFGFVHIDSNEQQHEYSKDTIIEIMSKNGYSVSSKFKHNKEYEYLKVANCWVWEGWSETTFQIHQGKSFNHFKEPIYIHFDFNNYAPEKMIMETLKCFKYITMCPPGKIKYFFTSNKEVQIAKDHHKEPPGVPRIIKDIKFDNEVVSLKVSSFNSRFISQSQVLNQKYHSMLSFWYPRKPFGISVENSNDDHPKWDRTKSIFANYAEDHEELMNKLFEFDWGLIQKPKLTEEEEEQIK